MHAIRWPNAPPAESIAARLSPNGRVWLDGVSDHREGRWSFLGADPEEVHCRRFDDPGPLESIDSLGVSGDAVDLSVPIPEWIGWIGYDAAWADPGQIGLRSAPRHVPSEPIMWFGRYPSLVAVDAWNGETWVLAGTAGEAVAFRERLERAAPRVGDAVVGHIEREDPRLHRARIERALALIGEGQIYQVNLARAFDASFEGDPLRLWLDMRTASPVPLGAYVQTETCTVLARTMERFLSWDPKSGRLWSAPIKGTIARQGDDERAAETLVNDAKERAEHSMIVDLMRNDLSRVAEIGSVQVREPLRVEPFAGLSHLVSTVECTTRSGVTAADVLRATFPPGSITGTPKLRAMGVIAELEATPRSVYTGCVGYLDRTGGLSLAVAIRTAVVTDEAGVRYFAGGGVVSASDPEREIAETELKARVFLDATSSDEG